MSFDNIMFDFDGTLVDTSEGIIKCMHYAFDKLHRERVSDDEIQQIIGPPLNEMCRILLRTTDDEIISKAVFYFRERYAKEGLNELQLYPGVREMIRSLKSLDKSILIVTSKPTQYTEIILNDFKIKEYFDEINGVELHEKSLSKSERLMNLINEKKMDRKSVVMVGDRPEDMLAAKFSNVFSIGVTYGYGREEDLIREGACKIFNTVYEVEKFLEEGK